MTQEYLTTEELAKRIKYEPRTITSKLKDKVLIEGIHYVNIDPGTNKKSKIRIPWNHLVRSFAKNPETALSNYKETDHSSYRVNKYSIDAYLKEPEQNQDAEEENTPSS